MHPATSLEKPHFTSLHSHKILFICLYFYTNLHVLYVNVKIPRLKQAQRISFSSDSLFTSFPPPFSPARLYIHFSTAQILPP